MQHEVGILTVGDHCIQGDSSDSRPVVTQMLEKAGYSVALLEMVPDQQDQIQETLARWADERDLAMVLTLGGVGFSPRDVTPEATEAVCQRMTLGIAEAMRVESLKITPRAMLSRGTAGIRGRTLIINLPGSPKAAKENLEAVLPALDHALDMLRADSGK